MRAKDFVGPMPPWFDRGAFLDWLTSKKVTVAVGEKHNWTDGQTHYLLELNTALFELRANYWSYKDKGWQDAIDWVEANQFVKGEAQ